MHQEDYINRKAVQTAQIKLSEISMDALLHLISSIYTIYICCIFQILKKTIVSKIFETTANQHVLLLYLYPVNQNTRH